MLEPHYFNLYLIRHAESEVNAKGDEMGQKADVPLSSLGEIQAVQLGERFQKENLFFNKIYSSDYKRAYHTSRNALGSIKGKEIILVPELREYSAGDWLGKKRSDVLTPDVIFKMNVHQQQFLPPNGEALTQVQRRASKWLEDTILYNKEATGNIAVFSHGMTIKCLLQYIIGFDRSFTWKISIDNTSITHLSFGDAGWKLHSINDCAHLKGQ